MLMIPNDFTSGSAVPAELYIHPVNHLWPTSTGYLFTRLLLYSHTRIEIKKKKFLPLSLSHLSQAFLISVKWSHHQSSPWGQKQKRLWTRFFSLYSTKIHQQPCVLLFCKLCHFTSSPMMLTSPSSLFCICTTASYLVSLFPFLPHPSLSWEFTFHRVASFSKF